jgi:hypothetical protein
MGRVRIHWVIKCYVGDVDCERYFPRNKDALLEMLEYHECEEGEE